MKRESKKPKRLLRLGRHGKVTTGAALAAKQLENAKLYKRMQTERIELPGLNINLFNKFSAGPFEIISVKVPRTRMGVAYEVNKRCIVGAARVPLVFGPRKWLDKQLEKYHMGYAKWCMTQGTAAEGL